MMLDPGDYNGTYDADAGNIALDFANTLSNRTSSESSHEWLDSYSNLVTWGEITGVLSDGTGKQLMEESVLKPEAAEKARLKAIELREVIYRTFSAVAAGSSPDKHEIEKLNDFIPEALIHLRVVPMASAFTWDWTSPDDAFDQIVWPVVKTAADLLTSDQLKRVGECRGDGCGWLFLDMSRNRSRRWCSMNDCGNREKARRHYHRTRKA